MVKTLIDTEQTALATALHVALAALDITTAPVMSQDRSLPRKEQAALARKLFRQLGLKGISVTAPNYSMAQSVDVRMPKREDYALDAYGMVLEGDAARLANNEARERLEAVLLSAFPNHEDRNDTQSDHFDYRWSIQ